MNRTDLEALGREPLIELVLGLVQRVAELEARLGLPPKTPDNSSLPPSLGRKPSGAGKPRRRRRKGRPGVARRLDPNPTEVREVRAARLARIAASGSRQRRRPPASATTTSRSRRSVPR